MKEAAKNAVAALSRAPRRGALVVIRAYQRTLSPDHGPLRALYPSGFCKYHPSCSKYAYAAVERFGITRGLWLAGGRLLRCNPWSRGGVDEVPGK